MREVEKAKQGVPLLALVVPALCLFLACACSRTGSGVRMLPVGAGTRLAGSAGFAFADFRQAFANFDFSVISAGELDSDSLALMQGLRLIMDGDMAGAESVFRETAVNAPAGWSRSIAIEILVQLYYFQSKWRDLQEMSASASGRGETAEESGLAFRELSQAPAEKILFTDRPAVLPLEFSNWGTPVMRLQVNGRWEKFWLDTGSGFTVLASDLADKLKISPLNRARAQAATSTNKKVSARLAVIASLRLGDLEITHHPALIVRKKDLFFKIPGFFRQRRITKNTGVSGILGMNAIKSLSLLIDYRKRTIRIARPGKRTDAGAGNLFWLGCPILVCRSREGVPLHFGLDTGATRSVITPNIFTKIGNAGAYRTRMKVWGAGGEAKISTLTLPRLSLFAAGRWFEFKDIAALPLNQFGFAKLDGMLGRDFFLACGSWVIDLAKGVFALENGP